MRRVSIVELPRKPKLEQQQKIGQYGEIVVELTSESEILWSNYLRQLHFVKAALYKHNNPDNTEKGQWKD